MFGHGLRTSGSELEHSIRTSRCRSLQRAGMASVARSKAKRAGEDCGKDAPWKSPSDFPTSLGNPAQTAGFPLSHSHDGGTLSTSYRTYRVLKKADILTCYGQVIWGGPAQGGTSQQTSSVSARRARRSCPSSRTS